MDSSTSTKNNLLIYWLCRRTEKHNADVTTADHIFVFFLRKAGKSVDQSERAIYKTKIIDCIASRLAIGL